MAKEIVRRTKPEANQCVCCREAVGEGTKVVPFVTDGETWCPQCFVYKRAPMERERFVPGCYEPIHCTKCGQTSVTVGHPNCGQCGWRVPVVLPPKPTMG